MNLEMQWVLYNINNMSKDLKKYADDLWGVQNQAIIENEKISDIVQSVAALIFVAISPNIITVLAFLSVLLVPVYFTRLRRLTHRWLKKVSDNEFKKSNGKLYTEEELYSQVRKMNQMNLLNWKLRMHPVECIRMVLVILSVFTI